ncbi:uncharacterized protein B0I36DRAFT_359544 [Microdochium trichocladiopsis]|uniref:BRCT domain-containing protein n=1 Tax=Microdochium trichocladiopsis TaxID=1682393 RepID=A0A9P8YH92_9PEZI|nr:uncharacterized protein B0I36DRAFT_359544 [Microdochium trichocladiopsis]KAH7037913.1 hypothetical protein B0I36DRAFT_359544 [Microdochium trichocladiopsis]
MPPKKTKKVTEKPIFQGCVIVRAGDLGKHDWTDDQVGNWITIRSGVYLGSLDQLALSSSDDGERGFTHVLANTAQYKDMTTKRKQNLIQKGVQVVTCDWLEDSIHQKRKLKENGYRLDKIWQKERKKQTAKIEMEEKAAKGLAEVERGGVNTSAAPARVDLNHVYMDTTCFSHDIILTRNDPDTGMVAEKWRLRLWESNAKPYLYHCTATFNKRAGHTRVIRPSNFETPGLFEREFAVFKEFFEKKTGIPWRERITRAAENKGSCEKFHYEPPVGGKPIGIIETENQDKAYRRNTEGEARRKAIDDAQFWKLLEKDRERFETTERERLTDDVDAKSNQPTGDSSEAKSPRPQASKRKREDEGEGTDRRPYEEAQRRKTENEPESVEGNTQPSLDSSVVAYLAQLNKQQTAIDLTSQVQAEPALGKSTPGTPPTEGQEEDPRDNMEVDSAAVQKDDHEPQPIGSQDKSPDDTQEGNHKSRQVEKLDLPGSDNNWASLRCDARCGSDDNFTTVNQQENARIQITIDTESAANTPIIISDDEDEIVGPVHHNTKEALREAGDEAGEVTESKARSIVRPETPQLVSHHNELQAQFTVNAAGQYIFSGS